MSATLTDLASALRERLQIIDDEKSRRDPEDHMQRLQKISERIEGLEQQLPRDIDPQLRHFLQRRSYDKALEYLTLSNPSS
ncbi:MAG: hypothetical protein M3R10_05000 [Verrucomicrobiota bacterium]|nr:hypothetical protein [Verrucomicrobiota bacterium]